MSSKSRIFSFTLALGLLFQTMHLQARTQRYILLLLHTVFDDMEQVSTSLDFTLVKAHSDANKASSFPSSFRNMDRNRL